VQSCSCERNEGNEGRTGSGRFTLSCVESVPPHSHAGLRISIPVSRTSPRCNQRSKQSSHLDINSALAIYYLYNAPALYLVYSPVPPTPATDP